MEKLIFIESQIKDKISINDIEGVKEWIEEYTPEYINQEKNGVLGPYNIISNTIDTLYFIRKKPMEIEKRYKILEFLLEKLADMYELDKYYPINSVCITLSMCIYENSESKNILLKILKLLLDKGINCKKVSAYGETPLHCLFECRHGLDKISLDVTEILLKNGVDVNQKKYGRITCLEKMIGNLEYIRSEGYLAETDIKINIAIQIIDLMVEYGLDIRNMLDRIELEPISMRQIWIYLFNHNLKKELAEKDKEIAELKKEIEELRYKPGNPGYLEAAEDFEALKEKKI